MAEKCLVNSSCNRSSNNSFSLYCFQKRTTIQSNFRNVSTITCSSFKKGFYIRNNVSPNRAFKRFIILESSKRKKVPLFVMMPEDTFGIDTSGNAKIKKIRAIAASLKALKSAGVHGITVEVWWGIVERSSPSEYNWQVYEELFKLISDSGLKLHVALSFHANMHLTTNGKQGVSLPLWIMEIGRLNNDIYYRDRHGFSNHDYLTLGVDRVPIFCGRTALQCYEDFMLSFKNKFEHLMGSIIKEISVGLGPSGELRYPAHPSNDGRWRFPGIGEFQCYDKYMMEDLKLVACIEGKPEWGCKGPENAGCYNSVPDGVPFFEYGPESYVSDYGQFFLEWYSGKLLRHADVILEKAAKMLEKYQNDGPDSVLLVAKIAVVYWWYYTGSHPAELTAGYYNTPLRDGYDPLALMLSRHGAALRVSCFEMNDHDMPRGYHCGPEGLLQQIWTVSKERLVQLTGQNETEIFDTQGLMQIIANCYNPHRAGVKSFTYSRMNAKVFIPENWNNFSRFVRHMNLE